LGINFYDTANVYSNGLSEVVLGNFIKKYNIPREEIVIATKVFAGVGKEPSQNTFLKPLTAQNVSGLSRKHIMHAVEDSLKRLQTDYIDLYQIHRWDDNTPIEETMHALHDLVKAGKVRYIGASSMYAHQFAKAQYYAKMNGLTQFISMQDLYNAMYREEEREMIPVCKEFGCSLIPWSPLHRGTLAKPVKKGDEQKTKREESDMFISWITPQKWKEADDAIITRVQELAEKKGVSMAQVALAWLLSKPYVAAPIVGFSSVAQLQDSVGAIKVKLTADETKYLEEPYLPKPVLGFR